MSERDLTYQHLLQIVELIKSSAPFSEFRLKLGEVEIEITRANDAVATAAAAPVRVEEPPAAPAQSREHRTATAAFPGDFVLVTSPTVGTFYRAPEPGARPFVELGQRVEADTTVCIIEVMKLMSSIPAGRSGIVRQILANDAEMVEEGQVLVVIDPDG